MVKRGAERDERTGKVVQGRIPRGSVEEPRTIKEGPLKRLADRLIK